MFLDLGDLHQPFIGGEPREYQTLFCETLAVGSVDLLAVAVALLDLLALVSARGVRAGHQLAGLQAPAHGAALIGDGLLVRHQVDDGQGCLFVELGGIGFFIL